jgi:hypothetical protein
VNLTSSAGTRSWEYTTEEKPAVVWLARCCVGQPRDRLCGAGLRAFSTLDPLVDPHFRRHIDGPVGAVFDVVAMGAVIVQGTVAGSRVEATTPAAT